jgi:para-aminobenzoate synthetase/4-amino-4-deoxychorismate lyase
MPAYPLSESALHSLLTHLGSEELFVFLETTKISRENRCSYLFLRPLDHLVCRRTDDPDAFLAQAEEWLSRGYYLAGWIGYEFGYFLEPTLASCLAKSHQFSSTGTIAELFVFEQPYIYDHCDQVFSGAGPWPGAGESGFLTDQQDYGISNLRLTMEKDAYLDAFARIKAYIAAGDTYQVNYTLKYKFDFSGSPIAFYSTLRRNQRVSYTAFIQSGARRILSFSPELFFRKQGRTITVRPMKGTLERGRTVQEDEALISDCCRMILKPEAKT